MNDPRALDRASLWACVALACVAVVPAALTPLWDADVWWVLRAGLDLVREGAVPRHNRYGFTAPDAPWIMHEWGCGALYAWLARGGLACLALPRIAAVAVTAYAAAWRSLRDARPTVASLCVAVTLTVFGGRFESPRPVGLTFALACALAAVTFEPAFARRHAVCTTALMLLWTNLHGSFPLGLAMLGLGLLVPGGDRRARLAAAGFGLLVTAVNPYGFALHQLALRYALGLGGDAVAVVHARVVEWWPLWRAPLRVASPAQLVAMCVMTVVAALSLRDARWRAQGVLTVVLLVMAARHGRHLGLAGVVCVPLLAGPLDALLANGRARTFEAHGGVVRACALAPVVLGIALWAFAARGRSEGAWVDASAQDEAAKALLDAVPDGARVFVELPFTGYALYVSSPRVRVFFDARNDCYPAELLREAFDLNDGLLSAEEASRRLRARGTTHALVRCEARAARSLRRETRLGERAGVCLHRVGP